MLRSGDKFEFIERFRVMDCPEYWTDIDKYKGGDSYLHFTHVSFNKFSGDIFRKFKKEVQMFREYTGLPLFGFRTDKDPVQWDKFARLMGFTPLGIIIELKNGEHREVYGCNPPDKLKKPH